MNIAVVISSCDAFSDCWEPLIYSIERYWKECPWNIYIISNFKSIQTNRIKFIKIGEDLGWASNLKKALSQIDAEYIIYMQEDYFINRKVQTKEIEAHISYSYDNNIDYLRLTSPYFDKLQIKNTHYALSPQNKKYRLCLQTAIWNKDTLMSLLIPGYTGWQFEWSIEDYIKNKEIKINSIVLQSQYFPEKAISYIPDTAVHKGMWTVNGYDFLIEHGFQKIIKSRKKEGRIITLLIHNKTKTLRPLSAILLRILLRFKINI